MINDAGVWFQNAVKESTKELGKIVEKEITKEFSKMERKNNCNNCKYGELDGDEEPCDRCNNYDLWKPIEESKPTLDVLIKQRKDLDKRIEELKNEDVATLIKIREVIQLYTYTNTKIDPKAKNKDILNAKEEVYIKLSDFLTAIKEGRLEIK